jgi:gluconate:H+ symporter, GntP family
MPEYLILLAMVAVLVALGVGLKLPMGIALAGAALAGALLDGQGFAVRHLVEGAFGFFDIILIIASAMIFMKALQLSGSLDGLAAAILKTFHNNRAGLLLTTMLLLMFPGMITGSSLAAVLSIGPIVAPVLTKLGLPRLKTAAFIAMGAIFGMIAPPVNIPAMIMGGGVDMPYSGLSAPLLLIVIPLAVFTALWLGLRDVRPVSREEMRSLLPVPPGTSRGFLLYFPLLLVVVLMVLQNVRVPLVSRLGLPAVFFLGSLAGLVCGRRFNFWKATRDALAEAMPILSILAGVGMFIQVMALTGARGWAVTTFLGLPPAFLYAGIAVGMPLFGGVSAFGAASVLGVPVLLALIGKNALVTTSALSAIVGLGDLVPPSAMASRFSAQVAGTTGVLRVLRASLVPAGLTLAWSVVVLLLAPILEKVL